MVEKTKEQLAQELHDKLQNAEYMNEVAMPGVTVKVTNETHC